MSAIDWSIFQRKATTASCRTATSSLGGLSLWWMTRESLQIVSERDGKYWIQSPELPRGPGACWVLITNKDQSTHDLLKPAFLIPLIWCKRESHDERLPQAVKEIADDVFAEFKQFEPCLSREWSLHLSVAGTVPDRPDLSCINVSKQDLSSGWTSLASGLVSAHEGKSPLPHVWSTGAWNRELGVTSVGGLEEKLRLCSEYAKEREVSCDESPVLFVPRTNLDEACEIKRKNRYPIDLAYFQETNLNPYEALGDYFSRHEIRQPKSDSRRLKSIASPASRPFTLKGLGDYTEADCEHFIGREEIVEQLVSAVMEQPVTALTGESGAGKSSLLQAGLCPAIRKRGFHVAYLRTDQKPTLSIPEMLSRELLEQGHFSQRFKYDGLRTELSTIRRSDDSKGLLIILDQFEEIVSDTSDESELGNVRKFLHDAQQDASDWSIRIVCSYRNGVNARIPELFEKLVGADVKRPRTIFLFGLACADAIRLIEKVKELKEQYGYDQIDARSVAHALVDQNPRDKNQNLVYPPFLQIVLAELESGRDLCRFISPQLENLGDLVGKYLLTTLDSIENPNDDPIYERIMWSLCLDTGQKVSKSFVQLESAASATPPAMKKAIKILEDKRLIRVSGEQVEIIHDQLAQAVIETLGPEDREAKRSKELLEARLAKYEKIQELCSEPAMVDLFRYRTYITTDTEHQSYLFACRIASATQDNETKKLQLPIGWFWTRNFPNETSLLALLRERIDDPQPSVRAAVADWLGLFAEPEDLEQLFALAEPTQHISVQAAAIKSLAKYESKQVLEALCNFSQKGHSEVKLTAVRSLSALEDHDCMVFLQNLATGHDKNISDVAMEGIARIISDEELPWLRSLFANENSRLRAFAVEQVIRYEQPEDRLHFQKLCYDGEATVQARAIEALASYDLAEDLPVLLEFCESDNSDSVRAAAEVAIASFRNPQASTQLRELLLDPRATVRSSAIMALANIGNQDDLTVVRKHLDDSDRSVVPTAVTALSASTDRSDLELLLDRLRACSADEESSRFDAQLADTILLTLKQRLGQFAFDEAQHFVDEESPWMQALGVQLLKLQSDESAIAQCFKMIDEDREVTVRVAVAESLLSMCPHDFPFDILIGDNEPAVRRIAVQSTSGPGIKSVQLERMTELARCDEDPTVRVAAIELLSKHETLEQLQLFRELAEARIEPTDFDQENWRNDPVVVAATREIARWRSIDAVDELKTMATSEWSNCRVAAVNAICEIVDREVLESWLNERSLELESDVLVIIDECLYAPQWWRTINWETP